MKKKLFFKLFIFAVIGSLATMTSCKDYDDDIDNLQEQIDQLATKSDVDTKLNAQQTSLNTAQENASNALTKAQEALTAAQAALKEAQEVGDAALTEAKVQEIADATAKVEAAKVKVETLAALQEQIATLKAELQATNEAEFEAMKAEINASLAEITKKVEDALGLLAGAVFDVELVPTYAYNSQIPWITWNLVFSSATEKDNVFEEGIDNAITFVKGTQVQTGYSFVIRVSPTNVIVTPDMITFQNSKGETYDNIKVTKVEPYEELLTRSTNGGGLWKVTVELKNYEKAAFEAATKSNGEKVLFAVAVNNSNSDKDAPSKVISTYDLEMNWIPYTPANGLSFKVDDTDVAKINNRYDNTSISLDDPGTGTVYTEKKWNGDPATAPTTSNTAVDGNDNRSSFLAYPAVQGQPITIALNDPTNQIKAMYVTLDYEDNAIDSAPSEWNAWNSYSYTGLGKVVEGTETEIIINSNTAINDYIGFRVFAVNYDGTLVDPDGKAFYVSLGKEATNWNTLNTVVTATQETPATANATLSAKVNATLSKLTGATAYEWTTDKADNTAQTTPAFDVFFTDANDVVVFGTNGTGSVTTDFSKVKKVYTIARVNDWLAYKDNKVYNGKLSIKNATGHVLATLDVTFKKVLPTAPEGFSVKTNQIGSDGIYRCYLNPDVWAAPTATQGTMLLSEVFNFGMGTLARYETTFAASQPKIGGGHDPIVVTGNGLLSVGKAYIDNTTQHATTVVYNYGKISTETKDSNGSVIDFKATIKEFPTIYSNIYNSTYSWNWATRAQLNTWNSKPAGADYTAMSGGNYLLDMPYSTSITYGDTKVFDLGWIYGVSTRDSKYNANLDAPYLESLQVVNIKLVSNANQLDEYFSVDPAYTPGVNNDTFTLKEKSGSTNPTADVPSTLVISAKDMYGNNVEIRLPMTVLKR